jgi:DNA polymerase III alpha subunit
MVMSADIDIDLPDRSRVLSLIQHVPARQGDRRHNSGVYIQNIPRDPVLDCAAIDYETAEQRGYFKIDLLNLGVYQLIRDQAHYDRMLAQEPDWAKLWQDSDWAKALIHVGNYTDLLSDMHPDSIPRMAAFISIIRPGKAHLQGHPWDRVFESVWDGDDSRGYTFKKSHAVSYARLVALHMNLIHPANQGD